jgi:16S rRNA (cytosine1407-C5)-methyltransferase
VRSEARRLPELFLERLKRLVPPQKFDQTANTFSEAKPVTFRINTLKCAGPRRTPHPIAAELLRGRRGASLVLEALEHRGFKAQSISWYPGAFILRSGRQRDLEQTEAYKNGEIYVQSLSSMIPPLALDPQPGEGVLDLAAAPGSKTTQMACLMKGEGTIVANDSDPLRFLKLRANCALQGATQVKFLLELGEAIGKEFSNRFDRVLLDAPCSAEGRFDTREPSSYRYWNLKVVQKNAKLQKKLIRSAVQALRPGGVLVYSTCTFAPEENEAVVSGALLEFEGALEIESIRLAIPNQMAGLRSWGGAQFDPSVVKCVRILPTPEMEGFFLARLRKK